MLARIEVALLMGAVCASALGTTPAGRSLRWEKRQAQAGAACGPSGGNAQCAPGLCCGISGKCGTGGEFCSAPGCLLSFSAECDGNKKPTGKDTSQVPRPLFGNIPYGSDVIHCTQPNKIALTFDDGPYIYTSELLDILKSNNVKATFFVTGTNGAKGQINQESSGYPPIVRRMHAEGHHIASHSWSHEDMVLITPEQRKAQILYNEIALADILGFFPTYFRPPYTSQNQGIMDELKQWGYHTTNYDLDTKDFEGDYAKSRTTYVNAVLTKQPLLCLAHDIHERTVRGFAQFMIDEAKKNGYQLTTLGDCLGDPVSNWYRDPATGGPVSPGLLGPKPDNGISNPGQSSSSPVQSSSSAVVSSATSASVSSSRTSSGTRSTSGLILTGKPTTSPVAGIKVPVTTTSSASASVSASSVAASSASSSNVIVPTTVAGGGNFFSGTNHTAAAGSRNSTVTGAVNPSGAGGSGGSPSATGPVTLVPGSGAGSLVSHPIAQILALAGVVAWLL